MSIAEDLKTLEDLHQKGKLTEAEFTTAKAAALEKAQPSTPPPSSTSFRLGRFIGTRLVPLLVLLFIVLAFLWYQNGTKATTQLVATAVHAPIQLKDEVENVPANSFKAIAFTLPYTGSVSVSLNVVRGNPMDVFVTNTDQLPTMQARTWDKVLSYNDFNALKTQVYERTGQLREGNYYLVLRDTSLGILSAPASDVSIKIQLKP